MLDGDSSGLEVCDLMGWAVSMEFTVALPDGAEMLVFITVGRLHPCTTHSMDLCLISQCS